MSVRQLSELERELEREATLATRIGRLAARGIGSLTFVSVQMVLLAVWIAWNVAAPTALRFDPFPFAQNHFGRQAERRDRLNLHVDVLAEQQVTLMLRYLQRICDHLGVDQPASERSRTENYVADTDVERLATEIDHSMRDA